jgi:antitoxin YefM
VKPIPKTLPISELRFNQTELIDTLEQEPILLTKQGHAVAVLVDPGQWNALLERLELLDDSVTALQARNELSTGEDDTFSWDNVKAELRDGVRT